MAQIEYNKEQNKTFLTIFDGILCQKSKEEREGYQYHRTEKGNEAYIKPVQAVTGLVTGFELKSIEPAGGTPFKVWELSLDDDTILSAGEASSLADRFILCAENMDFTKPLTVSAWKNREGKSAVAFKQEGESIKQKYTRDEPGAMPALAKDKRGNWTGIEQLKAFKLDLVDEVIVPAINEAKGSNNKVEYSGLDEAIDNDYDKDSQGIPF